MSERITAANLDEVIAKNEAIEKEMAERVSLIWSEHNPMQINSPIQLAFQILKEYGLIQLPIENHYLSGAIFCSGWKTYSVDKHSTSKSKSVLYGMA